MFYELSKQQKILEVSPRKMFLREECWEFIFLKIHSPRATVSIQIFSKNQAFVSLPYSHFLIVWHIFQIIQK